MNGLIQYGWYFLLIAVIGEMVVPFILAPFYKGYSNSTMAISTLGNVNSPVRLLFNLWMLFAGILLLFATPSIYDLYRNVSKPLSMITVLFISMFAVGACIFSCFFSVNETRETVTTASKIHGAASATGFLLLLLVPLFLCILSFKGKDNVTGVLALICFVLALVCFTLFVMADKAMFKNTVIAKEGLWQRLNLLFLYLPLAFLSLKAIAGGT